MTVTIHLTDEQVEAIAAMVAQKLRPGKLPLSTKEAGQRLGVSRDTVKRRVQAGIYPRVKGLSQIRIPAAFIDQLLMEDRADAPLA